MSSTRLRGGLVHNYPSSSETSECSNGVGARSYKILGVDRDILQRILVILRDKYPLADKANYFLERQGYSGINVTITNQRDALSHLVTLLSDRTLDRDGQLAQLHNAEEHLRRAITEPYERAIDLKFDDVLKLRTKHIELVVPLLNHAALAGALTPDRIDNKAKHVQSLRERGRNAKSRNKWDQEWEDGIKALLEAFECLEEMERHLSESIAKAQAVADSMRTLNYRRLGIALGIAGPVVGVIIAFLF